MGSHDRLLKGGIVFLVAFVALAVLLALVSGTVPTSALAAPAADPPRAAEWPLPSFQSAPRADFSATPRAGTAPLTVQFTDRSTGTIDAWLWSFGDGTTATVAASMHTYSVAGLYTVSLTVWSGGFRTLLSGRPTSGREWSGQR